MRTKSLTDFQNILAGWQSENIQCQTPHEPQLLFARLFCERKMYEIHNMRTVEVRGEITTGSRVLENALHPDTLRLFHGEGTVVGPWTADRTRYVEFPVNVQGSPIPLGKSIKATFLQKYTNNEIRNSMRLSGLHFVSIESTWNVADRECIGTARIKVKLPPPINWIAESFVAMRAKQQMTDFLHVLEALDKISTHK